MGNVFFVCDSSDTRASQNTKKIASVLSLISNQESIKSNRCKNALTYDSRYATEWASGQICIFEDKFQKKVLICCHKVKKMLVLL